MSITNIQLTPSQVYAALERCLRARVVPYVRSSPGIGKSALAHKLAKEYNLEIIDIRLAQCDPTTLDGLPYFNEDGRAEFKPFTMFPLEGDKPPPGKEGWLILFDELSSAPKQLQAAAYKVILDRMVGLRKLHENVAIMCAGNLETDNAVVHELSTAMQSRLIHLSMKVSHKDWILWAIEAAIDSRIMAFMEFRPALLHAFDPEHQDKTFACPRTWEFASRLIHGFNDISNDLPLLAGTLSAGPAQELITFCDIYTKLPKIDEIVNNPDGVMFPQEPSTKYALAVLLAEKMDTTNVIPLVKFLKRLPVECRVICMRMVNMRNPIVIRQPAAQELFASLVRQM